MALPYDVTKLTDTGLPSELWRLLEIVELHDRQNNRHVELWDAILQLKAEGQRRVSMSNETLPHTKAYEAGMRAKVEAIERGANREQADWAYDETYNKILGDTSL